MRAVSKQKTVGVQRSQGAVVALLRLHGFMTVGGELSQRGCAEKLDYVEGRGRVLNFKD